MTIAPRNREHEIAECLARDWLENHPFKTAWFNALSITFPLGEKFFIDSVRHYQDQVSDPKLLQEISGFCGQEGIHRREHDRYNQALCRLRGYDLDYMEGRLEKNIERGKHYMSELEQLASTAALEHITAIMAEMQLGPDNPMSDAEAPMLELWNWHAAEEMEHKSVAFDVFKVVGGDEKTRRRAMRQSIFFLLLDVSIGLIHMLKRDGLLWKWWVWRDGFQFLLGKGGILRRLYPSYKDYFREGFHPWQRDTHELLENWKSAQPA